MPTKKRPAKKSPRRPVRKAAPKRRAAARPTKRNAAKRPTLDTFTRAYLEAALWSSTDDDGTPLDRKYSIADIAAKDKAKAVRDCKAFQTANARWIDGDSETAGYDFWMTRTGSGSGFWDGDWPEPAATHLTNAAHRFGNVDLYSSRGRLYFSP